MMCGGDAIAALRITLIANAFLEAEVERLKAEEASFGFSRGSKERTIKGQGPIDMSVTYYVALPFVQTEGGIAAGQAMECPNEPSALRRAEIMARSPAYVGALAFKRTGDLSLGNFGDAAVLRTFGIVPDNLDEL